MRTFAAGLAALLALSVATPAEAVLCRKRKGAVVSRTKCRKKETGLDPAAIGGVLQGATGPGGTTHPRLRLVDANGTRLPGILNSGGDYLHPVPTGVVRIAVTPGGFPENRGFFYESTDCTGPRLVRVPGEGDFFVTASVRDGSAFRPADAGTPRTIRSSDFPRSAADCTAIGGVHDAATGICCRAQVDSAVVAAGVALDLRGHPPPFRVEIEE